MHAISLPPIQTHATTASTTATGGSMPTTTASTSNSTLSETQFLQLLTEQLQNQDPLQPEDDTQFLAQMAQFTSLQETDTMNQQLERLTAANYIGSTVTINPGSTSAITGQVTAVDTSGTDPQLVVNGAEYPLAQLQWVQATAAAAAAAAAASSGAASGTTTSGGSAAATTPSS